MAIMKAVADLAERGYGRRARRGHKHRPLRLPYPVRFVVQSAYEMGRSGARGNGD
ncbi:hypothetical protein QMA61_36590 [Streptomyces coelicoflavus]|uniref:hypothetical protein n=1 Tax=Streptomyces coelicoflavus TaxID=285562 RepID=UPI0024ACC189|nr:hypothetical protein [Streptomyces coelicoflavus]MDI6521696.1 hypothetical protein [Streptomyces coelicoflavus]